MHRLLVSSEVLACALQGIPFLAPGCVCTRLCVCLCVCVGMGDVGLKITSLALTFTFLAFSAQMDKGTL